MTAHPWSAHRLFTRLPYFLIALGFSAWFGGGLIAIAGRHVIPQWLQLPLSQPQGIAVDSDGRIYVASVFYNRVQVYDAQGRFLQGWFLPYGQHNYRLRIGEDGVLQAVGSGRLFRLSASGEELSSRAETDTTHASLQPYRCGAIPSDGHRYEIRDLTSPAFSIFPRVVKIGLQGDEQTVVTTPLLLWPFQGVFPAFGWAVLGMGWLALRRLRPRPLV